MNVVAFDHFNIRAPAALLEAVRDFYVQVLDLSVGARPAVASRGYWLYLSGQPIVHLMEWKDAPEMAKLTRGCLDHVAFSCADLDAMTTKLKRLGIDYDERKLIHQGLSMTQLKLSDPTGNVLELNFSEAGAP